MKKKIEFGISTFADVMPDPHTGVTISQAERIRQVVDDIVLADELIFMAWANITDLILRLHRQR
jgi:hypothetical protein